MTIIFDLNGTLFDPQTGGLVPGSFEVLTHFYTKADLHLVSKREAGRNERLIDLGIQDFFTTISFVDHKEEAIKKRIETSGGDVFIVGDYLHSEIRYGNKYGAKTIWLKRGHLAHLEPLEKNDEPWRTITDLMELTSIIP